MADKLVRTYKYTGQAAWKAGDCELPLSAFDVSGATDAIYEIYTIALNWYRKHNTRATVAHSAELALADGSAYISTPEPWQGSGQIFKLYGDLIGISAADFVPENITLRTTTNAAASASSWIASEAYPMELVVVYRGSMFKPSITDVNLYRVDAKGEAADDGEELNMEVRLAVENEGINGAGTLRMYEDGVPTPLLEYKNLPVTSSGFSVGAVLIEGATIGIGEKKWYTFEFDYTAQDESGTAYTETASARAYVGEVFTNVHLAGVSTGGVRFGGYSTAAENAPKFECDYPAYLYGGIAQIGEGTDMLAGLGIQTGDASVESLSSSAVRIVEVQFNKPYALPPIVLVSLRVGVAGYALGRCSASVKQMQATGFTAVIANYSGSAQDLGLTWAAFGTYQEG